MKRSLRYGGGIGLTLACVFLVASSVFAATSISTSISTGGSLTVEGATSLSANLYSTGGALFNQASTTAFLLQNGSSIDVFKVDTTNAGLKVTGAATSTVYFWVGSGGTNTYAGYTGGAFYVQGNAEIDGVLYFNRATGTSATTTDYLMVGSGFTVPAGFNYKEDIAVSGDVVVNNKATATAAFAAGSGTIDNLNMAGGDVYVADGFEVDGGSWFDRATTTDTLTVGSNSLGQFSVTQGATTRAGLVIQAAGSATANLFAVYNSFGAFLSGFTATGGLLMNVSSTTALRIQSSGTEVFSVNTVNADVKGVTITGQATTTSNFVAGTTAWAAPTNTATIVGSLYATGKATTSGDALAVGTYNETGTTTLKVITGATRNGCIEMTKNGADYRIYVDTAGTGLKVEAGPCDNNQ